MDSGIRYVDLRAEPADRRAALVGEFYECVYRDAFPKSDQAEGPDIWLPLMGDTMPDGQPAIHVVLACSETHHILGGVIFELYRASGCWLTTYIAVRPDARRDGVATGLISQMVHTISGRQAKDWILFAETENPERISDSAGRVQAQERLHILDRLGMRQIPIEYIQPPLAPGKQALEDLLLLCYAPNERCVQIATEKVAQFLTEFYAALGQADSPYLTRVLATLAKEDLLQTERVA